jgi:hypothetical protein
MVAHFFASRKLGAWFLERTHLIPTPLGPCSTVTLQPAADGRMSLDARCHLLHHLRACEQVVVGTETPQ